MAGDDLSTYVQRAGWHPDSAHRTAAGTHRARARFASAPPLTSEYRLSLPSRPENVAVARRMLECVTQSLGLSPALREDVRLAVTEACTNVVRHAYAEGEGTIDLVVRPSASSLVVVIADQGRGMGPSPDTTGPGLGLPLIAALADSVEVKPGRRGGSTITMSFARERESAAMRLA